MKTAEEILKEYIKFDDVNQSKTVELLPLTIVDAMEEYATQCQEDMANKNTWTFEEILDACYPTLGRGGDWAEIAIRLKEQKLNKQD